jgi:single-strand DNA-binding protein
MPNGIQIVAEARVGNDPELRDVSGTQVCNLSLAVTERKQNKQTQQWEDAATTWMRAAVWGPMGANVVQSITKGMLVNVTGTLSERKYTTTEGVERSSIEVRIETISPSLRFATADVRPNDRGGAGAPAAQQAWTPGQPAQQAPWQTPGGPAQGFPQQQPAQQQPMYQGPPAQQPQQPQAPLWNQPQQPQNPGYGQDVPF